jgi:Domain of unknown function (DUF222)
VAQNRLHLAMFEAVWSFDCRREHRAEGHASVVGWLQHHLHVPKRTARRLARLARFVARHPAVEDAMRAGHLTIDHVEAIAERLKAKHAEAWEPKLPQIVADAADMRFEDFVRDLEAFANDLTPEDAEDRFEDLLAGRRFQKMGGADFDGYGLVRGWLDPMGYETFADEHDRVTDDLFTQDWAFCQEVLGRDPDENELADLTRTRQNRAHDALVEMARRSKSLAGGLVASAPEVVLHMTLDTYEEGLRHKMADDPDDVMVVPPGGFCETQDGKPLSPVAGVYASLWGRVRRIVFGADDEIISFGKARELYTPIQKAAVLAKFRRCAHPNGCDITGRRLQIDHILERHQGGPTDIGNAQPLDSGHNRWKHLHLDDPPPDTPPDNGQRRGPPRWSG